MVSLSDVFYEQGAKDKLKTVQQIGELLQALDISEWQAYGERDLYHVGLFIEKTIDEVFKTLDEIEEMQTEEHKEIRAKLPPDPEDEAKQREQEQRAALYMAQSIDKIVPGAFERVKELIEKAKAESEPED